MRGFVWAVLGMAFFWPFIKGPYFGHFFSIDDAACPWAPFALNIATVVACAVLAAAARRRQTSMLADGAMSLADATRADSPEFAGRARRRKAARRASVAAAGALASLLLIVRLLLGEGPLAGVGVAAGAVACAVSFAVLAYAWMCTSLRLVRRYDPAWDGSTDGGVACALVVSYLASFVVELPANALPGGADALTLALFPALSCACWLGCERAARQGEVPDAAGDSRPARAATSSPGLIALVAGVFIVSGVLAGLYASVPVHSNVLSAILAALLAAFVAVNRNNARFTAWVWAVALIPVIMSALLVMGFSGDLFATGLNVLTAGRRSLFVLLWLLLAGRAYTLASPGAAALCSLAYVGLYALSRILIDALRLSGLETSLGGYALHGVTLAVALVTVVCSFAIMAAVVGRRASSDQAALDQAQAADAPLSPADAAAAEKALRQRACQAIAQDAGLTERETVVLELVSLGYTVARMAQERGVSENTVRTHTKGLYRKLDVHSKQEVIELVETRMARVS